MATDRDSLLAVDGPLWCDDFDADLPKLIPDAIDALDGVADVALWTRSKPTNGRINCPSCWHSDIGLCAYFTTREGENPQPPGFFSRDPIVRCTFWEAVRDEWCHDATIVVNRVVIWTPPSELMMQLMFDVRGWSPLKPSEANAIANQVLDGLSAAAERLREVIA